MTTLVLHLLILTVCIGRNSCQEESEEPSTYAGKFLGKFDSFSHQIDGELYAINLTSFLLKNFFYDGTGKDAYFWVGSSNHADRRAGYPVADEEGKTNVLKRYINSEISITLPKSKKISDLKWFAIYDVGAATTFAEVVFPEDFEPPGPHLLSALTRNAHGVKSDPMIAMDSKTLQLTNFNYDGLGPDTYFLVGSDPIPSSKGQKIPDENGYLEPLRPYQTANITLTLPGNMTMFDIDWLSVFNLATRENYGSLLFPRELNVPPSLTKSVNFETMLSNCEQIHEKFQLSWKIDSSYTSMIFEMAGKIGDKDYIAFGINNESFGMIGTHAIIAYAKDDIPHIEDYYMTAKTPCLAIPKETGIQLGGVCPARQLMQNSLPFTIHKAKRTDGITVINFTIPIRNGLLFNPKNIGQDLNFLWAIGHMNHKYQPLYHYLRNTGKLKLNFDRKPASRRCFLFTKGHTEPKRHWGPLYIADPQLTVFNLTLGPAGGSRGYEAITDSTAPNVVWYVNGMLAPELYVKRNQRYIFSIEGGNNILNPAYHHPFYISNDKVGGYETFTAQEKKYVQFYAGVTFDHKGRAIPHAAGRLCMWENTQINPRNWDEYPTFNRFRTMLRQRCDDGQPYILEWTPNGTIPNIVYYQSFRQRHMGWKIHIVDVVRPSSASTISANAILIFLLIKLF